MRDWEQQLRQWAKPPGKTEQERCDNAASAIRNAIEASDKLSDRGVSILVQGSYRNNTNVRQDSDVDIGVVSENTLLNDYPEGTTRETFGLIPSDYTYAQFKNDVGEALVAYFGRHAVTRGDKAFNIHETSYHVEADVAAFFEHRRYEASGKYSKGVELRTDKDNQRVINWPEQHYANGCRKNTDTGTRFKSIVRALKCLSNEMTEQRVTDGNIPSFLIECLVWNVPNDRFQNTTYTADVKASLVFLYEFTKTKELCWDWGEVSELKYLFRGQKKWTFATANAFTVAAWNYDGLGGQS